MNAQIDEARMLRERKAQILREYAIQYKEDYRPVDRHDIQDDELDAHCEGNWVELVSDGTCDLPDKQHDRMCEMLRDFILDRMKISDIDNFREALQIACREVTAKQVNAMLPIEIVKLPLRFPIGRGEEDL